MRRRVLGFLLVFLVVLPSFTSAQQVQQAGVVRVGVVLQRSVNGPVVNWTSNARWQRDLLVNYLNQHKPGKNSQIRLESVPLTSLSSREIYSEAHDKGCEYVVVMWDNSSRLMVQRTHLSRRRAFLKRIRCGESAMARGPRVA